MTPIVKSTHGDDHLMIYHWTTVSKAITAMKADRLQCRRWAHYIENQGKMVKGSSWSMNEWQWSRENPVCFVANRASFHNNIHSINGNRTYWQTKGMIDSLYDPNAYKLESSVPDEEFVEGTVRPLSGVLVRVLVRNISPYNLDRFQDYCDTNRVYLASMDNSVQVHEPAL